MLSLTEKEVEQLAHQLMKGNILLFISFDKKKIYAECRMNEDLNFNRSYSDEEDIH